MSAPDRQPESEPVEPRRTSKSMRIRPLVAAFTLAGCVLVLAVSAFYVLRRSQNPLEPCKTISSSETPAGAALPSPRLRYHALVVGINDYESHAGSGWSKLTTARPDAEMVADLLQTKYGFVVTRLIDRQATRGAVMASLDSLASLGDNDAAVVYFAGHGFYDQGLGEGYWIPSDARRRADTRATKEDWLWNSTITKIVGASKARHILIIADACYAGSLFRGDRTSFMRGDLDWYARAVAKPSRYLIASGDLEPVLDSGGQHSIFAQQILNYLEHPERAVFSASDLGIALREKVGDLTGQMVQMGPLAVATHGGGEFVFVKQGSELPSVAFNAGSRDEPTRIRSESAATGSAVTQRAGDMDPHPQLLKDALTLSTQGATNTASRLVASLLGKGSSDSLTRAVAAYLDQERQSKARDELNDLIKAIEKRKASLPTAEQEESAHPRVIACLGPAATQGSAVEDPLALLYRICLRAELERLGRVQVVERDALQHVLAEMNLASADLTDPNARTMIGKLLPASLLLLGDVFPSEDGDRIFLRLVDTETTRILASFSAQNTKGGDIRQVCRRLAAEVASKAVALKPLSARVARIKNNRFQAGIGRFHGATHEMRFALVEPPASQAGKSQRVLGKAQIVTLGDLASEFLAEWTPDVAADPPRSAWIKEAADSPEVPVP